MNEKLQEGLDKYYNHSVDLEDQYQALNKEMGRPGTGNKTLHQQMAEDATDGTIENRRFPQGKCFTWR